MTKFLLTTMFFLVAATAQAQLNGDTTVHKKLSNRQVADRYMAKGKSLRTTGIILMGAGGAAIWLGANGVDHSYDVLTGSGSGYIFLFLAGLGSSVTGLCLLISGLRYGSKAKLLMETENISQAMHIPVQGSFMRVGISIHLP